MQKLFVSSFLRRNDLDKKNELLYVVRCYAVVGGFLNFAESRIRLRDESQKDTFSLRYYAKDHNFEILYQAYNAKKIFEGAFHVLETSQILKDICRYFSSEKVLVAKHP